MTKPKQPEYVTMQLRLTIRQRMLLKKIAAEAVVDISTVVCVLMATAIVRGDKNGV